MKGTQKARSMNRRLMNVKLINFFEQNSIADFVVVNYTTIVGCIKCYFHLISFTFCTMHKSIEPKRSIK